MYSTCTVPVYKMKYALLDIVGLFSCTNNYLYALRAYFYAGLLAVQGLEQKYKRSKLKVFTYPDKQLVRQFDDLSDSSIFSPCVSTDSFKNSILFSR